MWILAATFGICFAAVYGIYWLAIERPEAGAKDALTRRLGGLRLTRGVTAGLVKEERTSSTLPGLDAILTKGGITHRLQHLLDGADVNTTAARMVIGMLVIGVLAYAAVSVVLDRAGIALVVAIIAASSPYFWLTWKRNKRLLAFEEQFPDAIDLIARAMRAGHGLTAGLGMVSEEVPNPVGREFKLLYDWQNFGMSLPDAMHKFANRMPLLDARFFVTSVLTQRESGGNLSEVLDNLSRVIRDRFRVKRQIRVLSAHGRMTGYVLAAMPPVLAAYFVMQDPHYFDEMLRDPFGVQLIVGGIVLQVFGVIVIRKLIDIEY